MNAAWSRSAIRAACKESRSMRGLRFTKANLDELKPGEREYFAWSVDLPGFGVRVLPSGKRSYLVQFRDATAKTCRRTIGDLRLVPLTMAVDRAQQLLAHARVHKIDLVAEEKAAARAKLERRARTLGAVITAYLSEPATRAKKSYPEIARYLETVWRDVHGLDAEALSRHDLLPTLRKIAAERGGTSANRATSNLSAAIVWSIRHGLLRRDSNPCSYLPRWAEKPRERALTVEELGQIWQAAPQVNPTFGAMVRLLILSGCRRSEIADLSWAEVDLTRAVIELPSARTKNKTPHVVPLAPAAVAIFAAVPRLSEHKVFLNFRSWSWAKARLDQTLSLAPWTVHDLRRSAATGWREHLGADPHLCELAINHAGGVRSGVAGTYDRSQRLAERRTLLEAWAGLIATASGEPAAPSLANVVPIGGRTGR